MQGLQKKFESKTKKNLSSLPKAIRGPRRGTLCRELDKALGKDLLFAESLTVWLSAKVTTTDAVFWRGSFAESLSLSSASISAKLVFAEDLALPRAEPSIKALCRGSFLAVGKGSLCRGLALGKAGPSAKLLFPVVLMFIIRAYNQTSNHGY